MLNKISLEKKAETARKKIGLSVEEMKVLQNEAHGLYQGELGGDMPAQYKDGTISRAVVMETVLDAGRLESDMKRHNKLTSGIEKFFKSEYKLMLDVVGPAFVYTRYEAGQPYEKW
jgi:hypothetical protein